MMKIVIIIHNLTISHEVRWFAFTDRYLRGNFRHPEIQTPQSSPRWYIYVHRKKVKIRFSKKVLQCLKRLTSCQSYDGCTMQMGKIMMLLFLTSIYPKRKKYTTCMYIQCLLISVVL